MTKTDLDHLVAETHGLDITGLRAFYKRRFGARVNHHEESGLFCPMYSMVKTDFRVPGALATRGTVFALDPETTTFTGEVVCVPFYKFFNSGEGRAYKGADEDIVAVHEKHDGSLIKLFYHQGEWVMATNGTPFCTDDNFMALFDKTTGMDLQAFGGLHDTSKIYIFELCTPDNTIVVTHTDYTVTLLLTREKDTWDEVENRAIPGLYRVVQPAVFDETKTGTEGVVVVYKGGHRIKRKTRWYVDLHNTPANGIRRERMLSDKWKVLEAVIGGYIDDYADRLTDGMKVFVERAKAKLCLFEALQVMKLKTIDPDFDLARVEDKEGKLVPHLKTGVFERVFPEKRVRSAVLNVLFGKDETLDTKRFVRKLF